MIDDVEGLSKEELSAVAKVRDDIATLGRHWCISLLVLQHLSSNYKDTRVILLEAMQVKNSGDMRFLYCVKRHKPKYLYV
jgi:hypothetical protein